jgi:hypothetical protein
MEVYQMSKHFVRPLMLTFLMVATIAMTYYPSTSASGVSPYEKDYWASVDVRSDPAGAHIYYGSKYYGTTSETKGVVINFYCNIPCQGSTAKITLTAKKNGYFDKEETIQIKYDYGSAETAEYYKQKVMIVLQERCRALRAGGNIAKP